MCPICPTTFVFAGGIPLTPIGLSEDGARRGLEKGSGCKQRGEG